MQSLSRDDVETGFQEIGESLIRARKSAEICVYGVAAIMLQFDVTFRTRDVDARVESGDHGALMHAARDVAQRRGWLRSWLSEAVTSYVSETGASDLHRAYPSEARPGLRAYVAPPDYLLAMKLRAVRAGTRDEQDAALLAHASGITTQAQMLALLTRYFPRKPPDPRRIAIVGRFAAALDEPSSADDAG